jgi:hypothetical protein
LAGFVSWQPGYESNGAIDNVLASILSLHNLHSFSVTFSRAKTNLAIDQLTNLRQLSIFNHFRSPTFRDYISKFMPIVIANNPDLTHLDVHDTSRSEIEQRPSIHEVLGEVSQSSGPPLRLQHLGFSSCVIRLDLATMRHLKSLTSLKLCHYERSGAVSDHVRHVWITLLAEGMQLTALSTDCVDGTLLRYLASYSGLKTLKLKFYRGVDDLADQFFRDVLPNHINTLETLRLSPHFEGSWCLGSETLDLILQCHKLGELAFAMSSHSKLEESLVGSPCISLCCICAHCKIGFYAQQTRPAPSSMEVGIHFSN